MNRKRWLWVTAIVAVLLVGTFTWAALHPAEGSRGVLYRVTDGKNEMYLLGSIHVGSSAMYPFGGEIRQAMAKSDTFVYECDTAATDAVADMRQRMALGEGETLSGLLGETLYTELTQVCDKLDIDMAAINMLKPWAVVNTLAVYTTSAEMGADDVNKALAFGVEKQVQVYAEANHKQTAYLETLTEQVGVLEGFSDALQQYLLQGVCDVILNPDSAKGMDTTIAQWPDWWRTGNVEAFANAYLSTYLEPGHEAVCAEYHSKLVTQRNARMAEGLVKLLESGDTCFVTVGLLHLALPEDSIVKLLRDKGYKVEQLSIP